MASLILRVGKVNPNTRHLKWTKRLVVKHIPLDWNGWESWFYKNGRAASFLDADIRVFMPTGVGHHFVSRDSRETGRVVLWVSLIDTDAVDLVIYEVGSKGGSFSFDTLRVPMEQPEFGQSRWLGPRDALLAI